MTAVEIIALVIIGLTVIKMIVLAFKPGAWYSQGNPLVKLFSGSVAATITALILGGIVLFYLLQELTIVQVFASMAFAWLLIMLTLAAFSKDIFSWVRTQAGDKPEFWRKVWLSVLVWLLLIGWVLGEMFWF